MANMFGFPMDRSKGGYGHGCQESSDRTRKSDILGNSSGVPLLGLLCSDTILILVEFMLDLKLTAFRL